MSSINGNDEEFKQITGKKKIKKHIRYNRGNNKEVFSPDDEDQKVDIELFKNKLAKIKSEMKSSSFLKQNLEILKKVMHLGKIEQLDKVICLGIGPFTTNINCLHQLAFVQSLIEELNISNTEFYDPVFSEEEKNFLKSSNIRVTDLNNEGCYTIQSRALIWLPHCPIELTNNILWANWQPESLKNMILLCNSIDDFLTKNSIATIESSCKEVLKISEYSKEIALDNSYHFKDIFNDMTFHIFDLSTDLENEFWNKEQKAASISVEMITKEVNNLNL